MTGIAVPRVRILFVIALLALASGCARLPDLGKTPLKPKTLGELQSYLLSHKADLDQFRLEGPFAVSRQDDFEIRLSATELVHTDLFLSAPAEKAPLVVFLHGHENSKDSHTYQALHLASWGMHSLVLNLPNHGPWVSNGRTVARIINFLRRRPEVIDSRIDVNKIVLVGHSFGGYAMAIALAEGAPAAGGILLDPAIVGNSQPLFLRQINAPMMLLAADPHVSYARRRDNFFDYIRSGVAEVSIKDATHEDAEYPAETGLATEELQITFLSALTAAAFSLSITGNFDYAWTSFGSALAKGKLIYARKK